MAKPMHRRAQKTHVLLIRVTFDKPMTKGQAKRAAAGALCDEYGIASLFDYPAETMKVRSVTTSKERGTKAALAERNKAREERALYMRQASDLTDALAAMNSKYKTVLLQSQGQQRELTAAIARAEKAEAERDRLQPMADKLMKLADDAGGADDPSAAWEVIQAILAECDRFIGLVREARAGDPSPRTEAALTPAASRTVTEGP